MVLKRFLTMVVGMLWASVLLGQTESNIPSPDLFDPHLDCSKNAAGVPASALNLKLADRGKKGDTASALDMLLFGSNATLSSSGKADGTPAAIPGGSALLGMFPVAAANCGSGTIATDSASYVLAKGYVDVYDQYVVTEAARQSLKSAQDANASTTTITARQTAYDEAKAKLDAMSKGSIYQAGLKEWAAAPAVTKAIAEWNKAVGSTDDEGTGYLGAENSLGTASFGGARAISIGSYDTTNGTYAPGSGNFDVNGKFLRDRSDTSTLPNASAQSVNDIKTNLTSANTAVTAIEKAIKDTPTANTGRLETLNEYLRQAKLERGYAQAELNAAYSDTTGIGGSTTDTIASRYRAFQTAETSLRAAESSLRSAAGIRIDASKAVSDAFQDAGKYVDQNVERHTYLHDTASDDGKTAAKNALDDAQDLKDSFDSYYGEPASPEFNTDNPAGDLLNALLKPSKINNNGTTDDTNDDFLEDAGDDGQALVNAVSTLHGNSVANKNAIGTVSASIEGLTGEGGAVDTNTKAITALDGRVTTNETDIAANKTAIATNTTDIAANKTAIGTNTAAIGANSGMIADNTAAIGANSGMIADNANMIGSNSAAINRNEARIGELSESLETVRAGVAASMALAGMPAINGRGVSIGIGSFDGESAFAVGFMIQSEMASFKVGVTSAGGATGASAGVGFQF